MAKARPPSICPVCGEDVPARAKSCPECGACEKSGWNADAHCDGIDLADEAFDYDHFVAKEFGGGAKGSGGQKLWTIVAAVLFLALAWGLFGGCLSR